MLHCISPGSSVGEAAFLPRFLKRFFTLCFLGRFCNQLVDDEVSKSNTTGLSLAYIDNEAPRRQRHPHR